MSQTIPTLTDRAYYTIRPRLDEADYTLSFFYNTRTRRYYVTMLDQENARLCSFKVVTGVDFLEFYRHRDGIPPGVLTCISTGSPGAPEFGELGAGMRCELVYFPVQA